MSHDQKPGMFRRYLDALLYVAVVVLATWAVATVMVAVAFTFGWLK